MESYAGKDARVPTGLTLRPGWLGVLFTCIALALYVVLVMYVDSDIEKQTRKGGHQLVAVLATVPMLLGFLQFTPLYILVGEMFSRPWQHSLEAMTITGILIALAYFGAGTWLGHIFRNKVFNSKMQAVRFYIFAFCGTGLVFSLLGGAWWYFTCKNASC